MKLIFLFIGCFTLSFKGLSQNAVSHQLDSFFQSVYEYSQINGNVLVTQEGVIAYKHSFGYADFVGKKPNTDSSGFTLASISKVFTSTAILQLRDKGSLKLDDLVLKYFPDFPYPDITIRHLLSHTSGLPDYDIYREQMEKNPNKVFSNNDLMPSLKMWNKPLNFKPGEKWQYSNTNFCLLALLVEKLSGLTFQDYLQKNIFKPSKMYNTYFQSGFVHKGNKNGVVNHDYPFLYSSKFENVDSLKKYRWRLYNLSGFVGQGNIITTTEDLLKFDRILYTGKILKLSTLNEAYTPTKLNKGENISSDLGGNKASYGLGWFILDDTSAGKIVGHTGGQPGGLSIFLRNIEKKQTVIMFDNAFNKSLYGNGVNAVAILNNKPVNIRKKSLIQEYGSALVEKGIDAAFCKFEELRADSTHYYVSEDDMNQLGLELLYDGLFEEHNELSLEVLKLNILLFPNGFNTYDSYGEALAKVGKKEEAVFMYKKSLELNPENKAGKKVLDGLLKK